MLQSAGPAGGPVAVTPAGAGTDAALAVEVLSSRPDTVTGGDALVGVALPRGLDAADVRVALDGVDVTARFAPAAPGLLGVLDGLDPGRHVITATARRAEPAALAVHAHPASGPVFSGPHQEPFVCETDRFATVAGEPLGPPLDADCAAAPREDWVYRSTAGRWHPLPDPLALPADVATTTTLEGVRTPYVVRVRTEVQNRGVTETAVLHDPRRGPLPAALDPGPPDRAWNGRLVHHFGGGCRTGWYHQGTATAGVLVDALLSRGFAVTSSTLTVSGTSCSDVVAVETLAMAVEEFTETHGRPEVVLGVGCSGGSYQASLAASAYPGLLDGLLLGCSFPDGGVTLAAELADARLLRHWATTTAPGVLAGDRLLAVTGYPSLAALAAADAYASRFEADRGFDDAVPAALRYHPERNPDGARATPYDAARAVWGVAPATGAALRPLDNTGVQYGLGALADGVIDVEEFLALNAGVGGLDRDGRVTAPPRPGGVAPRMRADPAARVAAYRTGRLLDARGLGRVPVVDYRAYTDDAPEGDVHLRRHSLAARERLLEAYGDAAGQVLLVERAPEDFDLDRPLLGRALEGLDAWARAVAADRSGRDRHAVVAATRPAGLTDACTLPDGTLRADRQAWGGTGPCDRAYPAAASPRLVAGGPVAADVVTCALAPPDRAAYPPMTDGQWARLLAVFPDGVCHWAGRGPDAAGLVGPWLHFPQPGTWLLPGASG